MNKTRQFLSILLLAISGFLSLSYSAEPGVKDIDSEIKVYYFHATRRCVTCEAVEVVARKAVRNNYGDEVEFIVVNREKDENKSLVEKYKISGQTLLIVKGEKVENITNYAFMNARKNPEKVEDLIRSTIESLIE